MIAERIARELGVKTGQVEATIELLDGGATVPFVARYRKEATGALDDGQLRILEERLTYLRELEGRRQTVIRQIDAQGKLSDDLRRALQAADTKTELEDLYLPFKPKRRTKAQIAREAGLGPLAERLKQGGGDAPVQVARAFINAGAGFADVEQVLEGAQSILIEELAETAPLLSALRDRLWQQGVLRVKVVKTKAQEGEKFRDYFDYGEAIKKIPSHRALAVLRGHAEGVLRYKLVMEPDEAGCLEQVARFLPSRGRAASWLEGVRNAAWKTRLLPAMEKELVAQLREAAEAEAIRVFGRNLKELLLAAPAGQRVTLGLDPGLRTGVKVAVVDGTGKVLATQTIYPHVPRNRWDESINILAKLCRAHGVDLISIGNGTGSRETEQLVVDLLKRHPELGCEKLMVSEAGASVYSASQLAADELPDLDVTLRGAVSIARRLQDPLAELVKIEPKAIGVGQYQHDVDQSQLGQRLEAVVEDCVNAVGVDLNSASESLLARVSGLGASLARNIIHHRNEAGAFSRRAQLKKVPRLGPKAFEQAAGFLRIRGGEHPLDASGVHPEAYPLVERIAKHLGKPLASLVGDSDSLRCLDPALFVDQRFGNYTVRDVLAELEKPGRDPRPEFRTARFAEGVEKPADLHEGMTLEGVVTNVANFGAFVDVGVHQDGLVHISQLADRFIKDPHEVVKPGQVVTVRVLEVDLKRNRISLSMRSGSTSEKQPKPRDKERVPGAPRPKAGGEAGPGASSTLADRFARAKKGGRL